MNYQITSDNIEMSPSMTALAHEKMKKVEDKLQHVHDGMKSFRIVMNSMEEQQFLVKIHAMVHGKEYFVEEPGYPLENAMAVAVNRLERVLEKEKVIMNTENWEQARDAKRFDPVKATEEELM
jgi:ribosome-associated translation inhibitor RaiA